MSKRWLLAALVSLAVVAQESPTHVLPGPLPLQVEASPGLSLTLEHAWQAHSLKGESFSYVEFSPDGKTLVTSSSDGSARLWSTAGEMLQRVENGNMVFRVRFDASGERFITAVYDGSAKLWDRRGKLLHTYAGHRSGVTDALFLEHAIATGSDDGRVFITSLEGRNLATVKQQGVARNLAVSPDRRLLACAFDSGEVRVVDAAGRPLHGFSTGQGRINDIRFSPDGSKLMTSGFDGTVRLWTRSGKQLLRIDAGDGDWVYSAGFSRDGGIIGTVSGTGLVVVWTFAGKPRAQYRTGRGRVNSIAFSPRQDRFAVIDHTGAVLMFTYHHTP